MSLLCNKTVKTIIFFRHYSVLCKKLDKIVYSNRCTQKVTQFDRGLFWERDRKGGYQTTEKVSYLEHLKNGFKELKIELKLFAQEMKEFVRADPLLIARPGN